MKADDSPSDLCSQCRDIFSQPALHERAGLNSESHPQPVHHTKASLEHASSQGCPFCQTVLEGAQYKDHFWDKLHPEDELRVRVSSEELDGGYGISRQDSISPHLVGEKEVTISANVLIVFSALQNMVMSLLVAAQKENEASRFVNRRFNDLDLRDSSHYQRIQDRLFNCQHNDGHCPEYVSPLLPRRVLDVGTLSDDSVKLHITSDGEKADYVALSYCWGEPQVNCTTKSNLEQNSTSISISTLPATIQDAIFITRQLGFRFLWIDAFCIIQDSNEDKNAEISQMTHIYNYATLTIAASTATKVSEGFLGSRKVISTDCRVPFPCPDGSIGEVSIFSPRWHNTKSEPLNTRGWTFQERLLSPRNLIFGEHEILWRCQSSSHETQAIFKTIFTYKDVPSRLPLEIYRTNLKGVLKAPPNILPVTDARQSAAWTNSEFWKPVVIEYSTRELSFESDRLPALGGLAQSFATVWNDTYVAGLWKKSLIFTLLWYVPPGGYIRKRGKEYKGPSWSWLSVSGAVQFHTTFVSEIEVMSCEVSVINPALPYGQVSSGLLTIRAPALPASAFLEDDNKLKVKHLVLMMDDGSDVLNNDLLGSVWFMFVGISRQELPTNARSVGITADIGSRAHEDGPSGLLLLDRQGRYERLGCFHIAACPSWHKRNPFRNVDSGQLGADGKKLWRCQIEKKLFEII